MKLLHVSGNQCPYCNSNELEVTEQWLEPIAKQLYHQNINCHSCGKRFSFVYKLIGWYEDVD